MINKGKKINEESGELEAGSSSIEELAKSTLKQIEEEERSEGERREKIEEAAFVASQQKTKKRKLLNLGFFLLNIAVVVTILIIQLLKEDFTLPVNIQFNAGWFLTLILVFLMLILVETLTFNLLIKKDTGRNRMALSFKTSVLGKYYDSITPMSLAGKPYQVYYLSSRDVKSTTALSIPVSKYIIYQLTWVIVSFLIIITYTPADDTTGGKVVLTTAVFGFLFALMLSLTIIVFSSSKRLSERIVRGILKLLVKIKIIKNYDKAYTKAMHTVSDYQSVMRQLIKEKLATLKLFGFSILSLLLKYTIPFCVFAVFAPFSVSFGVWVQIFSMCVLIDLAAGIMPLPGGTGISEFSFTALFAMFFQGGTLFWALIIWRIMTYYIYIFQGLCVIVYDYLRGNKKFLWTKRSFELQDESSVFRQAQIDKFRHERNKRRRK